VKNRMASGFFLVSLHACMPLRVRCTRPDVAQKKCLKLRTDLSNNHHGVFPWYEEKGVSSSLKN